MVVMTVAVMVRMMMVAVGADALDMVVMALLRRANRRLMADDLLTVLTKQAVHVDIAPLDALDTLDERVDHQRLVVEIAGLHELDLRVARRDLVGLIVDALNQDTGEEKIGKHHDALEPELGRTLQHSVEHAAAEVLVRVGRHGIRAGEDPLEQALRVGHLREGPRVAPPRDGVGVDPAVATGQDARLVEPELHRAAVAMVKVEGGVHGSVCDAAAFAEALQL